MNNYPDGFDSTLLDGPTSLADQVDPNSLVIEDSELGLTIIGAGEDFESADDYLEDRGKRIGLDKLIDELGIPFSGKEEYYNLDNYLDYVMENNDLDELVLDTYDGVYGENATDIPAR